MQGTEASWGEEEGEGNCWELSPGLPRRANRGQRRWVPWQGERLLLGCETELGPGSEAGRGWWLP